MLGHDLSFWSGGDTGRSEGLAGSGDVRSVHRRNACRSGGDGLLLEGGGKLGEFFPDDLFPQ